MVVIIGAICLSIIAIANFLDSLNTLLSFLKRKKQKIGVAHSRNIIKRRKFIKIALSIGIVAIGGYLISKILKMKDFFAFVSEPNSDGYLIANKKTGVIHHSKICNWHLPNKSNQVLDFRKLANPRPHKYRNINIYEIMSKQCEQNEQYEESIVFLKKAIDFSPERVHLYDKLVRLYGRQKQYSQIQKVYENGIMKVQAVFVQKQNKQQMNKIIGLGSNFAHKPLSN